MTTGDNVGEILTFEKEFGRQSSWACRLFSKAVLKDNICNYKEVSDAILAALGFHVNRNFGDQFYCGFYLAQTIRLQLAQLCWWCHRRSDSGTLLGVIETQGVAGEVIKLREGNQ